jgi:hypothetical protein
MVSCANIYVKQALQHALRRASVEQIKIIQLVKYLKAGWIQVEMLDRASKVRLSGTTLTSSNGGNSAISR